MKLHNQLLIISLDERYKGEVEGGKRQSTALPTGGNTCLLPDNRPEPLLLQLREPKPEMKALYAWLFLWLSSALVCGADNSHPNIVFIISDDQGWNDVSWHDSSVVTPNLQQLADTGVRLEHNYVQPICTPTRSALMTGYYPYHLGRQRGVLSALQPTGLTMNKTLLPERLAGLGYSTHAIGKWHLGFCDWDYTPTYRGFNTFYGFYNGAENYFTHDVNGGYDLRDDEVVMWEANGTYSLYLFAEEAEKVIKEHEGKEAPFFLYLAFPTPHTPYEVPDEYLDVYPDEPDEDRRTLLGMITAMDDVVGRVMAALDSSGFSDNTLIVFTSDNGGVNAGLNTPLRGSKGSLWEGGTRVPGLIHGAMLEQTPRVHNGLLHVTDWHNTLLAAAGSQELPDNDGFNQWETLQGGQAPSPREAMIYNLDVKATTVGGIRVGRYKFLMGPQDTTSEGPWLFDLEEDFQETTNLAEERPDLAAELRELLLAQLESLVPTDIPGSDPAGDPSNWDGAWSPGWCTAY